MYTSKKYHEVLEEVQPHYALAGAIVAVLAAAASAYQQSEQAKQSRRQRRGAANASGMPQGMAQVTAPTADRFTDSGTKMDQGGGQRLGDILGKGTTMPATEKQQGFSLGVKHLGEDVPSQSQAFSLGAQPDSIAKIGEPQPEVPQQAASSNTASDVGGYAQTAATLYSLYNQMKDANKVQPGPAPKLGPMDLSPTARRFGV